MTETERVMDKLLRSYFCVLAVKHDLDGCECWQLDQCEYCKDYQLGKGKPNYPMPAIPLAVLHTPDYILIATPDYWEGELMEFIIVAEFNRE